MAYYDLSVNIWVRVVESVRRNTESRFERFESLKLPAAPRVNRPVCSVVIQNSYRERARVYAKPNTKVEVSMFKFNFRGRTGKRFVESGVLNQIATC